MNSYCHICGKTDLISIDGYEQLKRVTSDCKPWTSGGSLCVCRYCGNAQPIINREWKSDSEKIYADYDMYQQSSGAEPVVFNDNGSSGLSRSDRIMKFLSLGERGRLLDIGCGNGALLKSVSHSNPGWLLTGADTSCRNRSVVEAIPNVIRFHNGSVDDVPGRFDIVTMVHTLEHIVDPISFLGRVKSKIEPGGKLLVQVPDCKQNPFALTIADHALHCFLLPLLNVIRQAGFKPLNWAAGFVPKELTIVAVAGDDESVTADIESIESTVRNHVEFLREFSLRSQEHCGAAVFGSSIAATCLFAEMEGNVSYFVDEDASRVGGTHLGKRIVSPDQVLDGDLVLLPLTNESANNVRRRWPEITFADHPVWVT